MRRSLILAVLFTMALAEATRTVQGQITEIIDASGDGAGSSLSYSRDIAVDGSGNVYVTGDSTNNAFKITPGGVITQIIDATGDGMGACTQWP